MTLRAGFLLIFVALCSLLLTGAVLFFRQYCALPHCVRLKTKGLPIAVTLNVFQTKNLLANQKFFSPLWLYSAQDRRTVRTETVKPVVFIIQIDDTPTGNTILTNPDNTVLAAYQSRKRRLVIEVILSLSRAVDGSLRPDLIQTAFFYTLLKIFRGQENFAGIPQENLLVIQL